MQMQLPKIVFINYGFELEVKLNQLYIDFRLFCDVTQIYYTIRLTHKELPYPANHLFGSVEQMFAYFIYLSDEDQFMSTQKMLDFQQSDLIIRIAMCQGSKLVEIVIKLNKADLIDNGKLLRLKLEQYSNEMFKVQRLCWVQYTTEDKNKTIEKQLKVKFFQFHQKQLEFIQKEKQKGLIIQKTSIQIQNGVEYLKYLQSLQIQSQMEQQQSQKEVEIQLQFDLNERQNQLTKITPSDSIITDKQFSKLRIKSNDHIPLFGKYSFTVEVGILHQGLSIGIQKYGKESYPQATNYISLNTNEQKTYVHSLPTGLTATTQLKRGDVIKITINRSRDIIIFKVNSDQIEFVNIPMHLQKVRLYPFVELHSNDKLRFKNVKIEEQ